MDTVANSAAIFGRDELWSGITSKPKSLQMHEWPEADRIAWEEASRPAVRLSRGGAASHLAKVSRDDIANRYGLYLDFLKRTSRLDMSASAASLVIPCSVDVYLTELRIRVSSVTIWNSIYKLRLAAKLIAPGIDFNWLVDLEKDVASEARPRNKADRLVLSDRLVEAALTLIEEAERFGRTPVQRARGVRNGLMVALLALHPIRIKNFATLQIGNTFSQINGRWWLSINVRETKSHRLDERRVPTFMTAIVNRYIQVHRPILIGRKNDDGFLWTSSTSGRRFTIKNMGTLISKITLQTVGVDVSPHLFRTSAASTASAYGTKYPHLASGVLGHRDPRVTDEHYIVTTGMQAGNAFADIIRAYRD